MRAMTSIAGAALVLASVPAVAANARPKLVNVGDTSLAYLERGKGEPVILVHGGLQDYRMWSKVEDVLSKHYRVIAYSRRNHYPNAVDKNGWPDTAADLHARDLSSMITALRLGPVILIAHSSGAHAALFFAAEHPDLVRALVVNEPPASGLLADTPPDKQIAADFAASLQPAREAFRRGDLASGVALFTDAVSGEGTFAARDQEAQTRLMDNAIAHQADAVSTRPRPIYTCAMAAKIRAPILITNGSHSPRFFHAVTDKLASCVRGAERASFDASHGVPAEQPRHFAEAVLSFLRDHQK